ncbi:MAG: hypothetical protein HY401_04540 [Elusimicrobia bacterium]|nr:hypothetical protein [Elusimicrobiota bacterium]
MATARAASYAQEPWPNQAEFCATRQSLIKTASPTKIAPISLAAERFQAATEASALSWRLQGIQNAALGWGLRREIEDLKLRYDENPSNAAQLERRLHELLIDGEAPENRKPKGTERNILLGREISRAASLVRLQTGIQTLGGQPEFKQKSETIKIRLINAQNEDQMKNAVGSLDELLKEAARYAEDARQKMAACKISPTAQSGDADASQAQTGQTGIGETQASSLKHQFEKNSRPDSEIHLMPTMAFQTTELAPPANAAPAMATLWISLDPPENKTEPSAASTKENVWLKWTQTAIPPWVQKAFDRAKNIVLKEAQYYHVQERIQKIKNFVAKAREEASQALTPVMTEVFQTITQAGFNPQTFLTALIFMESSGKIDAYVTDKNGLPSKGLTQMQDATAQGIVRKYSQHNLSANAYDPISAIKLGIINLHEGMQDSIKNFGFSSPRDRLLYALVHHFSGPETASAIMRNAQKKSWTPQQTFMRVAWIRTYLFGSPLKQGQALTQPRTLMPWYQAIAESTGAETKKQRSASNALGGL